MKNSSNFFRAMFLMMAMLSTSSLFALSIKDSTYNSTPVWVVSWLDNVAKPRKVCLSKSNFPGVCLMIQYYDGASLVNIVSPNPNDAEAHNRGFGATVHHINGGTWVDQGGDAAISLRYQGAHHAIFDLVQTVDGKKETVTYTFIDGLDYFQWSETVQCAVGSKTLDSRGPYCTMMWDGIDNSAAEGLKSGAQKILSQPVFNGPYTFGGTCDIPFVQEWAHSREVGFVQTQSFTQQQAGVPDWSSTNIPASGSSNPSNLWALDFQMNYYDLQKKITWGMPYGYMEGAASTGTKGGFGQYSVSVMFDALSTGGVDRLRTENAAIHSGSVVLTAIQGTVVTTGPVGTSNPATQTLSPAGYDHNYRAWWLQANVNEQAEVTMNVSSGVLKNPLFRVKGLSALPKVVRYNGTVLVENIDYYASFNVSTSEAWVTLAKSVSGSASILIQVNTLGASISAAAVTPATVLAGSGTQIVFSATASSLAGSISKMELDLTSVGGSKVLMSSIGNNNYTYTYTVPNGVVLGAKQIVLTATDDKANTDTRNISLKISSGIVIASAGLTPSTVNDNVLTPVTLSVSASDNGAVASVKLDLSALGGGTAVAMSSSGSGNYTLVFNVAAGISLGSKTVVATVTDDFNNTDTVQMHLTVVASVSYFDIYTDASSLITNTWNQNGVLAELNGGGAFEGTKDYSFGFNVVGYYAGYGLQMTNAKDFSGYDFLEISYVGPTTQGAASSITISAGANTQSAAVALPASATYTTLKIPLSSFTSVDQTKVNALNFGITGIASGSGTLRVDNIRLSKAQQVTTEVNDEQEAQVLRAYPNPTQDLIYFQKEVEWTVYSSFGQQIMSGKGTSIEGLAEGMYFIKIKNQTELLKVIKN